MIKEKKISPPQENISDLELTTIAKEVPAEDLEKQKDYDKRMKGYLEGMAKLNKKYKIRLIQIPAKIIYYDQKYEDTK